MNRQTLNVSRHFRLALTTLIIFILGGCLTGLIFILTNYPVLQRPPPMVTPVAWNSLPQPIVVHPEWTSFTNPNQINEVIKQGELLWAATDGGAVVWDWQSGQAAKFTTEHGLAENVVTSLLAGPDGSIWFGTASGGISRFDGSVWTTYTTADGLPSNSIRDLITTADGVLWAATDQGIGQYDGRRWYQHTRPRSLYQLQSEDIRALAVAPDGSTLWAATDRGPAVFNGIRWEARELVGSRSINDMRDITSTPDGALWAATPGGLLRYDGSDWTIFTSADGLASEDIAQVTARSADAVWVRYREPGLGLTRWDALAAPPIAHPVSLPHSLPGPIQGVSPLADGMLFLFPGQIDFRGNDGSEKQFATPQNYSLTEINGIAAGQAGVWTAGSNGVNLFNGTTWQSFSTEQGLPAGKIEAITLDEADTPWVALNPGNPLLAYYRSEAGRWQTAQCATTGPASSLIREGVQSADGQLWFATTSGVARFDGVHWQNFNINDGLPSDNVQALTLTQSGQIAAGTDKGLAVYADGRWLTISNENVQSLAAGVGGKLWYFNENGLFNIEIYPAAVPAAVQTPAVSWVYDQLVVGDSFWIATAEGLFRLTSPLANTAAQWAGYLTNAGAGSTQITALGVADDGTLWAGESTPLAPRSDAFYGPYQVQHSRLNQFDGRDWQNFPLPIAYGLLHPVITDILITPAGDIWLATLGGISQLADGEWHAFSTGEGLPGAEVYTLAYAQDTVWAVTAGGLARLTAANQWQPITEIDNWWPDWRNVKISSGPNDELWVGRDDTMATFDGSAWNRLPLTSSMANMKIRDFTFDAQGQLWLAGNNPSLPDAEEHYLGKVENGRINWRQLQPAEPFFPVDMISFAPDGELWLGNDNGFWLVENVEADRPFPARLGNSREPSDLIFRSDQSPWMAQKRETAVINPLSGERISLPLIEAAHTYALVEAADRSLWVGTDRGLARLKTDGTWDLYPAPALSGDQTITTLTIAADGSIFVGTLAGDLWHYRDGVTSRLLPAPSPARETPVSTIIQGDEDEIWTAYFGVGVRHYESGGWRQIPTDNSFTNLQINSVARAGGSIWLGTNQGLVSIAPEDTEPTCRYVAETEDKVWESILNDQSGQIWAVEGTTFWQFEADGPRRAGSLVYPVTARAPDGAVWIATEAGLVRHQKNRRQTITTAELPGPITSLAIDQDNTIWAGMEQGLGHFDGRRWEIFTSGSGLGGNEIQALVIDETGALWIVSNGGINRFAAAGPGP